MRYQPDKRVYILQPDVAPGAMDDWYSARIRLADGEVFITKDYVILHGPPQAGGQAPAEDEELAEIPATPSWQT